MANIYKYVCDKCEKTWEGKSREDGVYTLGHTEKGKQYSEDMELCAKCQVEFEEMIKAFLTE